MKTNKFVTNGGRRTEWINSNNEYHKKNEPAVIDLDKNLEEWYLDGIPYRKDGPWKTENGVEHWKTIKELLIMKDYHRKDGPALIYPKGNDSYPEGREEWYKRGKLHREDGPALSQPDKQPRERWYLEGKPYDFNKYLFLIEHNYNIPKEKIVKMKLEYGNSG